MNSAKASEKSPSGTCGGGAKGGAGAEGWGLSVPLRSSLENRLPRSCFLTTTFGATLGAQPSYRTSRSFAFVLTLGIIVVYYVISFSFSSLGVKGTLSPLAAAWLPVLISLGAGGLLLRQASR